MSENDQNLSASDKKRKREDHDEEAENPSVDDLKRKVSKNSEETNEIIDMNKLGQSDTKEEASTIKEKEIDSKKPTLPKFGYVPQTKIEKTTDDNKNENETAKSKVLTPKFGYVAKSEQKEETNKSTEEKSDNGSKKEVTPKEGVSDSQSPPEKPKFQLSFLNKSSTSSENKSSTPIEIKPTVSSWQPLKMTFGQKSPFSSTTQPTQSSLPTLNVEKKEKPKIPENIQEQSTGEENESILFSGLCMLYIFDNSSKNWKDKGGKSTVHINGDKSDKSKSRILVRNFYSKRILLNSLIFDKMKIMVNENQPNSVRFTAFNEEEVEDPEKKGEIEKKIELRVYMLRFKEKSEAETVHKVLLERLKIFTDQNEEKNVKTNKKEDQESDTNQTKNRNTQDVESTIKPKEVGVE